MWGTRNVSFATNYSVQLISQFPAVCVVKTSTTQDKIHALTSMSAKPSPRPQEQLIHNHMEWLWKVRQQPLTQGDHQQVIAHHLLLLQVVEGLILRPIQN